MRIDRLELIAYGHFSGVVLDFGAGKEGLHLVLGANEAGKSTALEALTDLLFGIPHRSTRNFKHQHRDLRIGASIRDERGETLSVVRRKASRATLRDGNDREEVDETWLTRQLGGLGREAFERQFGLSYAALIAGGQDLVEGKGDLAELLFSSGAGLWDLHQVRGRLRDEAGELYKYNAHKPKINEGLRRLRTAEEQVHAASLSTSTYVARRQELEELVQRAAKCEGELRLQRGELQRNEQLASGLRHAARLREVVRDLESLADVPLLDEKFAERRWNAQTQRAKAEQSLQTAQENLRSADEERAALQRGSLYLELADQIHALQERLGAYEKGLHDLPGLRKRAEQAWEGIDRLLRSLGMEVAPEELESRRPSEIFRQEAMALTSKKMLLTERFQRAEKRLTELQAIQRHLADPPDAPQRSDPAGLLRLRTLLKQVEPVGRMSSALRELETEAMLAEEKLAESLERLGPWKELPSSRWSPVPPAESEVESLHQQALELENQLQLIGEQFQMVEDQIGELTNEIRRMQETYQVPTPEDLRAARARRDALWEDWLRQEDNPEQTRVFQREYLLAQHHADQIADRMLGNAQHVATVAERIQTLRAAEERATKLRQRQSMLQGELERIEIAYGKLWESVPRVSPPTRLAARSWFQQFHQYRALADGAKVAISHRDRTARGIKTAISELSIALSALGIQGSCQTIDEWIVLAEDVVESIDRAQREESERSQKLRQLQIDLRDAAAELDHARNAQLAWNADWEKVCQGIGTQASASPDFVLRYLETWNRLSEEYREYQGLVRRADGIEQDLATFKRSVSLLAERAALVDEDDPRIVVRKLSQSLRAAEETEKRHAELSARIETETKRVAAASEQLKTASVVLEQLAAEARCTSMEQFAEVEHASRRKREAQKERRSLEELLIDLARGVPLTDFLVELGNVDEGMLRDRAETLRRSIGELQEQWQQATVSAGLLSAELKKIEQTSLAVAAAEQADSIRSQLAVDIRRYVRVKLAEGVLSAAMELYRQQHQGPTLERASNYVRRLSCGSLVGLRCEAGDSGNPVLLGVRGSGETISVDGMSEGLADQLYLALRLASLDQYLQGGTRLPFVVDDILIKFDDERSVATLKVLAELSDRTQVIFFTHHRHLVDLAKKELSPSRCFIQELPRPDTTLPT